MADGWTEEEWRWLAEVGLRVRLARVRLRLSQDELGHRTGVLRVTVGSIERGDHPAAVLNCRRIVAAVGLPLSELLDGPGADEAAPDRAGGSGGGGG